jgi:dihydrofolate synthase/folylpolyglutamate synthase
VTDREYLFSLEQFGIKLGLDQIRALVSALGHPDRAFQSIVVAGTNGKGSVTAMVERGLRAAGYRTGRFTSPHLVDIEERVAIDGAPIAMAAFDRHATTVREAAARLPAPPSFFEATTALALDAFRAAHVEVAVLEVGLGGRLDATNVVTPTGVAITSVDFDHEAYLGDTLAAIATEKAGVIKPDTLVVVADNPPVVQEVMTRACARERAILVRATEGVTAAVKMTDGRAQLTLATPLRAYGDVRLSLRGRHQVANAIAAARLLEELDAAGRLHVGADAVRLAIEDVCWPGRLELLRWRDRDVLIDGAHNPAGARALASYVLETYGRRLPMVVGAMRDKKIDALLSALAPAASAFVCTAAASSRAAPPEELAAIASRVAAIPVVTASTAMAALECAHAHGDTIVVAGSLYLAGEIRALIP